MNPKIVFGDLIPKTYPAPSQRSIFLQQAQFLLAAQQSATARYPALPFLKAGLGMEYRAA